LLRQDSRIHVFPQTPNSQVVGGEFLNFSHAFQEMSDRVSKMEKMEHSDFKSSIELQLMPPNLGINESQISEQKMGASLTRFEK
jgi:hypothetical protein